MKGIEFDTRISLSEVPDGKLKCLLCFALFLIFLHNACVKIVKQFHSIYSQTGSRPTSKTSTRSPSLGQLENSDFTMDVFKERVNFANTISTLEQEMADEHYTPSRLNDDVMPDAANEMNPGK